MKRLCALIALMNISATIHALPSPTPMTEIIFRGWFSDFEQPLSQDLSTADIRLLREAKAVREGRFAEAKRLLEESRHLDTGHRNKFLNILFTRLTLDRQFSLVGGGFGSQRQLQIDRAEAGPDETKLQAETTEELDYFAHGPAGADARLSETYRLIFENCQTIVLSALRGAESGMPVATTSGDECKVVEQSSSLEILEKSEKTIVENAVLGSLAGAKGDFSSARQLLMQGREQAVTSQWQRSEFEFDLRLGDLAAMPHGYWQSAGYNLAFDGLAQAVLEAGSLPKSRAYPSTQAMTQAKQWYASAEALTVYNSSPDLRAELQFRKACLLYLEGDAVAASALFAEAGDIATLAGSMRDASMGWGMSAIIAANQSRFDKAMSSLEHEEDVGGAASLIELSKSHSSNLLFKGNFKLSIAIVKLVIKAPRPKDFSLGLDGSMSELAALYRFSGDSDRRLYWARTAVSEEEALISRGSKYFIDPGFLDTENVHLATLLFDVAMEFYLRTMTEPNVYWDGQLSIYEKGFLLHDTAPEARIITDKYTDMKAALSRKFSQVRRISRGASCVASDYQALSDELRLDSEFELLADLDNYLAGCGDADAIIRSDKRLRSTDMQGIIARLRDNSRRANITEQDEYGRANNEISGIMDSAIAVRDYKFIEPWLTEIEQAQGVTGKTYFTRIAVLLGTGRSSEVRDKVIDLISNENAWRQIDDHGKVSALRALVEAYAQLGDSSSALRSLLNLWREQSSIGHRVSSTSSTEELRFAALLRTDPAKLSQQETEDLLRLCLSDDADSDMPPEVDMSTLTADIPKGVTVLVYFLGSNTWLWRLEKDQPSRLIPLPLSREYMPVIMRLNRKMTALGGQAEWQEDAASLYAMLIQPAGEFPPGQTIAVAGAGYLKGLPFDVLGKTAGYPLGLEHPVVYVEDLLGKRSESLQRPRQAAVIGAGGKSLVETEPEAKEIASLLGVKALIGADARKAPVAKEIANATLIHFATHAFVDNLNPYRSYLLLSDNDQMQGFELATIAKAARQITFSACDSGVSFTPIGEEPQPGFARGLALFGHAAGSRWIVSSLWKADDVASRELMISYYQLLIKGLSPSDALFQSKQKFAERSRLRSSPWMWAGFTLSATALSDLRDSSIR